MSSSLYFKYLFKQALCRLPDAHYWWQFMLAIIVAAGAFFGLPFVGVSPWWSFFVLGIFFLYSLFQVAYNRDVESSRKLQDRDVEIQVLKDRTKPKFEIVFGNGGSFMQENQTDSGLIHRLYRIAIVNGETTVANVKVQLDKTEGFYVPFLPVEMHQMHDQSQPFLLSFSLNPHETKYMDIVSKIEGAVGVEGEFHLWYAVPGIPALVSPGQYKLGILVTGDNVEEKRETFSVSIGEQDRLLFGLEDGVFFNA